ncbi:hypothetical protein KFE25_004949 [Diacronema lutheri]|uniref:Altered inheritance of mitochondria protein 24, mitochondrial n=1 Tax=Diacronema lutheri TaxID=2081491 RepID=A0A8J5XG32_DIALT|nr:hypothetical protein KFE25_004949 [Diacronema lutheri]
MLGGIFGTSVTPVGGAPLKKNALGMVEFNAAATRTGADLPIKYEVLGSDMQLVSITLPAGEKVISERGGMMMMDPSMRAKVNFDNMFGRCCSGEGCLMDHYTNHGDAPATIGLTPNFPAKVIPLHMRGEDQYRTKSGAFMASTGDIRVNFELNTFVNCCFSGQGCCNQTIQGEGTAFLAAMGTLMSKTLAEGEVIVVDTESVVAWQSTAKLGIRRAGSCITCCCGGEGLFNSTLTGPGTVYFQSMSYGKFKRAMTVHVTKHAAAAGAAGGIVGAAVSAA